jgi:hypothetical protein
MSLLGTIKDRMLMRIKCGCETCKHTYRHQCNRINHKCQCCGFNHARIAKYFNGEERWF